jgi:uncharacterized membrane protein YgcG
MVAPNDLRRAARHLFYLRRQLHRLFPAATLDRIEAAIRDSERRHRAELRFVVEGGLDVIPVWRGLTPRDRAIELFSQLRVWDTAENNGVLIYVQLADRDIEIVADRGLGAVSQPEWDEICRRMEEAFHAGAYEAGALAAVSAVSAVLERDFPPAAHDADELPNRPLML